MRIVKIFDCLAYDWPVEDEWKVTWHEHLRDKKDKKHKQFPTEQYTENKTKWATLKTRMNSGSLEM
jgi:hypothetical protein